MNAKIVSTWGAIIVSVIALVTFTGALVVSFFRQDPGLLNLTVGAAIANATTAIGFWLGSSSGSQKKDEVIGAALAATRPAAVAAAPVVTAISPLSGAGAGGTTVTVTGSGFTGATSVQFGASSASTMTIVSDTQITATSPAGSGTVDVTVATPAGTSATSPADQFTYGIPRSILTTLIAITTHVVTDFLQLSKLDIAQQVSLPGIDSHLLARFGIGQGAYLAKKAASNLGS